MIPDNHPEQGAMTPLLHHLQIGNNWYISQSRIKNWVYNSMFFGRTITCLGGCQIAWSKNHHCVGKTALHYKMFLLNQESAIW